jgi:hypothetical protein
MTKTATVFDWLFYFLLITRLFAREVFIEYRCIALSVDIAFSFVHIAAACKTRL